MQTGSAGLACPIWAPGHRPCPLPTQACPATWGQRSRWCLAASLRCPSIHPSHLPAWKGHSGRCLGSAYAHTACAISSLAIFKSKCHFCHQGCFSSSLLLAHPLERRDTRGRPPPTPRAADETKGRRKGGPQLPMAGAGGEQEEEAGGQSGRVRSARAARGGVCHCAEALTLKPHSHRDRCGSSSLPPLWIHCLPCLLSPASQTP